MVFTWYEQKEKADSLFFNGWSALFVYRDFTGEICHILIWLDVSHWGEFISHSFLIWQLLTSIKPKNYWIHIHNTYQQLFFSSGTHMHSHINNNHWDIQNWVANATSEMLRMKWFRFATSFQFARICFFHNLFLYFFLFCFKWINWIKEKSYTYHNNHKSNHVYHQPIILRHQCIMNGIIMLSQYLLDIEHWRNIGK